MAGHNSLVAEETARDSAKKGGLWRDAVLPFPHCFNTDGQVLTGATTPLITKVSSRPIIRWAANDAGVITMSFCIPGDYDEFSDALELRLKVLKSTAGNAAGTMSANAYITRDGVALPSAVAAAVAPIISDGTTISTIIFPWTRNNTGYATVAKTSKFKANDELTILVTPAAHDTAVIDCYGARVRYKAGLSMYYPQDRDYTGNASSAVQTLSTENGASGNGVTTPPTAAPTAT